MCLLGFLDLCWRLRQVTVPIANPSFENPSLSPDDWTVSIPGWSFSPDGAGGVWHPTSSALTNGATDGANVLWVAGGFVFQDTAATIQPGVSFTLSVE